MKKPILTIGMPTYDDFDGCWATINAIRLYHKEVLDDIEILVVDNNHKSEHAKAVRGLLSAVKNASYTSFDTVGPALAKDQVFRVAKGEYVLCIDSHIMFPPEALKKLINFYKSNPDCEDIITGPLLYDDHVNVSTHFTDVWSGEMWGQWGTDDRGRNPDNSPFEVKANGCGLLSCKKSAWLGFNKNFVGFGGEEWYIHEKFRQAGKKCICLPFLVWYHRFGRPGGVPYPLHRWQRVRNYVIGHTELGLSLGPVYNHFVKSNLITENDWKILTENPDNPPTEPPQPEKKSCGVCGGKSSIDSSKTLEELYKIVKETPSDINEHTEKLRELASQCDHVVEFNNRHGISTVAILAGQPKKITSVDNVEYPELASLRNLRGNTDIVFVKGDSREAVVEECDMLFIDTQHTAAHVWAELKNAGHKVRKWIVFHDTEIFGEKGDNGSPGILYAIRRFLKDNKEWTVVHKATNNHGLIVISKVEEERKQPPGILKKTLNFTKAMITHVKTGGYTVSDEVFNERIDACVMCEHRAYDTCSLCGCPIDKKASLSSSVCPDTPPKWLSLPVVTNKE